jgi:putative DNA primase/helicase
MIDLALHYGRSGYPVFPLTPGGKSPLISREDGGHGCRDATTSVALIEQWWEKSPNANIGIATGKRSGLLVIDVDPRKSDTWLASLNELSLPQTFTVRTWSRGFHIYLAYPRDCGVTIGANLLPAIDWRGEGGYVVAAGSVVEGALYEIARNAPIATAPAALIERIRASRKRGKVTARDNGGHMVIPDGARNDQLFRIGCALRRYGVDLNAILESLRAVNADHCEPQLSDDELRLIAGSAARYAPDASQDISR